MVGGIRRWARMATNTLETNARTHDNKPNNQPARRYAPRKSARGKLNTKKSTKRTMTKFHFGRTPKQTQSLLMSTVSCNKCRKVVVSYAVENIEHNQEPDICQCDNNEITIRTEEMEPRPKLRLKSERVECNICKHNTFELIPDVVTPPSLVKLYCERCKTKQYHNVTNRPTSLLDTILQETPQKTI